MNDLVGLMMPEAADPCGHDEVGRVYLWQTRRVGRFVSQNDVLYLSGQHTRDR